MRLISRKFVEGKPSAREITLGYTTMWFAGEHIIGYKYLGIVARNNPGTGYAGQIDDYIPNGNTYRLVELIEKNHPVYKSVNRNFLPTIVMFSGKSANAHMLDLGHAKIYFSYDKFIGFEAFDKMFVINTADNSTMARHIENMKGDHTNYESVDLNTLNAQFNRYFGQYERGISCV